VEILNRAGVPCGPIYRMDEVFADPQVRHLQVAAEVDHPKLGKYRIVNQPVKLSRTPAQLVTATPERGAHTDEVLREAGYDDAAIESLRKEGIV
jgi:formyl-CoA transferase